MKALNASLLASPTVYASAAVPVLFDYLVRPILKQAMPYVVFTQ